MTHIEFWILQSFKAGLKNPVGKSNGQSNGFYMKNFYLAILFQMLLAASIFAQQPEADLARFTVLVPKDGMQKQFEEGYKRHLQWHIDNGETWNWYGWFIASGTRRGYFIDVTFGHQWADFDKPVNPKGDTEDNLLNVLPYAKVDTVFLCSHLTKVSLQTASSLSANLPKIYYLKLKPGRETAFEKFLVSFREGIPRIAPGQNFLWFRVEDGAQTPQYILFLPHANFEEMRRTENLFARLFEQNAAAQSNFQDSVAEITSETMRYRADLTFIPTK